MFNGGNAPLPTPRPPAAQGGAGPPILAVPKGYKPTPVQAAVPYKQPTGRFSPAGIPNVVPHAASSPSHANAEIATRIALGLLSGRGSPISALSRLPSFGTVSIGHPLQITANMLGGGFLPPGALYVGARQDQGRDGHTDPGGPIVAPGDGVVQHVLSNAGGFGPSYPVVHFTTGPYAGHSIYLGHTFSALHEGDHFKQGDVLSHTGTAAQMPVGNATVPGWFEIGFADSGYPGGMGQSSPFGPQGASDTRQGNVPKGGIAVRQPALAARTLVGLKNAQSLSPKAVVALARKQMAVPAAAPASVPPSLHGLTAKGASLSPSQIAAAARIVQIGAQMHAPTTAIEGVIAEAILESGLNPNDPGNPRYGGILAGNVQGTFPPGSASEDAQIRAAFHGGQGFQGGGWIAQARGGQKDLIKGGGIVSGSGSQFLGETGVGLVPGEASKITAALLKVPTGSLPALASSPSAGPSTSSSPTTSSGGASSSGSVGSSSGGGLVTSGAIPDYTMALIDALLSTNTLFNGKFTASGDVLTKALSNLSYQNSSGTGP